MVNLRLRVRRAKAYDDACLSALKRDGNLNVQLLLVMY